MRVLAYDKTLEKDLMTPRGVVEALVLARYPHGALIELGGTSRFVGRIARGLLPGSLIVDASGLAFIQARQRVTFTSGDAPIGLSVKRSLRFDLTRPTSPTFNVNPEAYRILNAWLASKQTGLGAHIALKRQPYPWWVFDPTVDASDADLDRAFRFFIGRGSGSTPSGDDFLTGAMALWHRMTLMPGAQARLRVLAHLEAEFDHLTTTTSTQYLRAALTNQFSSHVLSLLEALVHPRSPLQLTGALNRFLRHGATSGVDAVTGMGVVLNAIAPKAS